jgi:DNA-binding HxlR family transcriptional regulator
MELEKAIVKTSSSSSYEYNESVSSRAPAALPRRTYGQYCALSYGMDVLGERWTMILVRELLLGPKRYKDLLDSLPGIGTNLLAARLRELEDAGVVERATLPPPAGSAVYQLTEAGEALESVALAIGRWGARFLGKRRATDRLIPSGYFFAMRAAFRPEIAGDLSETYEFRIGERVFEVSVHEGRCRTAEGRPVRADAVFELDAETLNDLLFQNLSPADALASGAVDARGAPNALDRFTQMFALSQRPPASVVRGPSRPGRRRSAEHPASRTSARLRAGQTSQST